MERFEVSGDAWRRRRGFRVKSVKAVRLDGDDLRGWLNGGIVADRLDGGERRSASHRAVGNTGLVIVATLLVRAVSHWHFHRHRLVRGRGGGSHSKRHQQHCDEQDQSCDHRGHGEAFRAAVQFGQRPGHLRSQKGAPDPSGTPRCGSSAVAVLAGARIAAAGGAGRTSTILLGLLFLTSLHFRSPFSCCSKRANHHITSVPWYRVKTHDP